MNVSIAPEKPYRAGLSVLSDLPILAVMIFGLYLVAQSNYLLFHSLVEFAILGVTLCTFAFAWNSRFLEQGYIMLIGLCCLPVAICGVLHTLAFQGMSVFPNHDGANLAPQLWLAGRFILTGTLVVAPLFWKRKLSVPAASMVLTIVCGALLYFIFTGSFPQAFVVGEGLTPFKIYSEYVIIALMLVAMGLMLYHRERLPASTVRLLCAYYVFECATSLAFTSYFKMYDGSNMMGHFFLLIGSYFFYKAVVEAGVSRPFDFLFRELTQTIRARDEFLSIASHELKTPLTPLKIQLQILQRDLNGPTGEVSPERLKKALDISNRQIGRLTKLVDSLLDVSRITAGRLQLHPESFDLSELISEIVDRHSAEQKAAGSDVHKALSAGSLVVKADPLRMDQVITNLYTNAIKYAPNSEVEVGAARDGASTVIWVSDTGPGVPKSHQDLIFDRFERVADSGVGGMGLGLYISRQIVEAHGGTVALHNKPGGGSHFEVRIPDSVEI